MLAYLLTSSFWSQMHYSCIKVILIQPKLLIGRMLWEVPFYQWEHSFHMALWLNKNGFDVDKCVLSVATFCLWLCIKTFLPIVFFNCITGRFPPPISCGLFVISKDTCRQNLDCIHWFINFFIKMWGLWFSV